jgi:GT2 family glycosyltransferase
MNKLTICLVTWNGRKFIEDCLASVENQTFKDFSLIIIDNGSTDETLSLINERYPHLRIVKHKENTGFSRAYNQALHWSRSDYALCLNQDVVMEPDFTEKLVRFMDEHPGVGAACGKIYKLQEGEKTKYIDTLGLKLFSSYRAVDKQAGVMDEGQFENEEEVFGISGAIPMYRVASLDDTAFNQEYFDEDFFAYKEDVDLAHRLRSAGWSAWVVPSAIAYHERSVAANANTQTNWEQAHARKRRSKFANFYSYRNHLYFLQKNFPFNNFSLMFKLFWYEGMKAAYIALFEPSNFIRAWRDVSRLRPKMKEKREFIEKKRKVSWENFGEWIK